MCSHVPMNEEQSSAEEVQARARGSNEDEYRVYVAHAAALGWPIKSYEEWLNS